MTLYTQRHVSGFQTTHPAWYTAHMLTRPLTKRQLGWLLLIGGLAGFVAIIGIDILDAGREGGIGPAQQAALAFSAILAFIGLTLLPLGDTLA